MLQLFVQEKQQTHIGTIIYNSRVGQKINVFFKSLMAEKLHCVIRSKKYEKILIG